MRPIILKGHERPLTQLKYNREGDLIFSTARDQTASVWYAHNGERLGTLHGHNGAIFTVDSDPTSKVVVTGAADNTIKLWEIQTGKNVYTWTTLTTTKRIEFSPDGKKFLAVNEKMMGHNGAINIYEVNIENPTEQNPSPILTISIPEGMTKFTFAAWTHGAQYIIVGHADGFVSKFDGTTGEHITSVRIHESGLAITDLQTNLEKTYAVTSSKDKSAKLFDVDNLNVMKTYVSDTPLNTASITSVKDYIIVGGGQEARDVTTTSAREGKFEARFYHKIFEDEIGRVKGHFGPLNCIVVHPKGTAFASGGEDGYIRLHHFEKQYFDFQYDVERFAANA
ncbi:eukaryotic translation initiation factor 3 subunit I [Nadsonia fulvescens var. elongata DSM 6958]|uniref:Eukaryotic translation initiation factor 3 subunit I n=1 Tax=Nadsonia fulvescens var. elongata DSM 6958 TaxID=857566 RepID=A0A1E3PSF9_9ASCO|nr:eukaryotic translation initiation factor 3 subunit I [Nadsonia fulvescens var. elongata DSM 6958]